MPASLKSEPPTTSSLILFAAEARADGREILFEHECRDLLASLEIRTPDQIFIPADHNPITAAENAWDSLWGDDVVVKVVSPEILHKTDLGGVAIVRNTPAAIAEAIEAMRERLTGFDLHGFVVSELVEHDASPGGELLLNVRWTRDFGPVVSFAAGGVATEFFGRNLRPGTEIAVLSPGLTTPDGIVPILEEKAITPMVTRSFRGHQPRLAMAELERLIARLLHFAQENVPEPIREMEINPVAVTKRGLVALDVLVKLGSRDEEVEPPRPIGRIEDLLRPRSVAIVGVSKSMNPGRIIVRNLLREGFDPELIWIVKPGIDSLDGVRCVGNLESLPAPVDLLVLSVGAEQVPPMLTSVLEHHLASSVIVIPGGIGEREGTEEMAEAIRAKIRKSRQTEWGGPVVNGPNSLGIRSVPGHVDTLFLPDTKLPAARKPGAGIALVSQSGAFIASRASHMRSASPRYLISIGNQLDLTAGDYLSFLADDSSLDVIAFYIEGFRPLDGRRWLEAAARATKSGKTVILYRAGRTPEGAKASASHTAAIAGDAVISRELARGSGVVVADSLEEFEDLTTLFWLLRDRPLAGLRIGAMSNAGYESVAFADNAGPFRFVLWSPATAERIGALFAESRLDRIMNVTNPLDVNPQMTDEPFVETARAILGDPGVDVGLIGCVPLTGALQTLPQGSAHAEDIDASDSIVSGLAELWRETQKPWAVVVDAGPLYDPMVDRLERAGIPVFRSGDRAIRLLGIWAQAKLER